MAYSRTFKTAILSFGKFLVTLTSLVIAAILSRIFSQTDYAAYRQTILAFAFVAPLLQWGLPQSLYYFIPEDKANARVSLTGNLFLLFSLGCLFTAGMWLGGNDLLADRFNNPSLKTLLLIYSPYGLLSMPILVMGACLISNDKVKLFAAYSVLSKLVILFCVVGFTLFWATPKAAITGFMLATTIVFVPAIFIMYKTTPGDRWLPTRKNMYDQLKYCIPLGMAGIIGALILNLNKIIVSCMCAPEEYAVYANGAMEIPLIAILTLSIKSVLLPEFVQYYKDGQYATILSLWKRAIQKTAVILIPIMIFLFIMAPEVMRLLFSSKYSDSALPFRVLLLLLLIRTMSTDLIFLASNHVKLILIRSLFSLGLNLIMSYILIRHYGYMGAPFSLVIVAYAWSAIFTLYFVAKILKTKVSDTYPFIAVGKIFLASFGGSGVFLLTPIFGDLPDLVSVPLYLILYFSLTLILFHTFQIMSFTHILQMIRERKLHISTYDRENIR